MAARTDFWSADLATTCGLPVLAPALALGVMAVPSRPRMVLMGALNNKEARSPREAQSLELRTVWFRLSSSGPDGDAYYRFMRCVLPNGLGQLLAGFSRTLPVRLG
jgi:hypothetical protein